MSSFKNLFTLGGKRQPPGGTSPTNPICSLTKNADLSWAEIDKGDDPSPFWLPKGGVQFELQGGENPLETPSAASWHTATMGGTRGGWARPSTGWNPSYSGTRTTPTTGTTDSAHCAIFGHDRSHLEVGHRGNRHAALELRWQQGVSGNKNKIT